MKPVGPSILEKQPHALESSLTIRLKRSWPLMFGAWPNINGATGGVVGYWGSSGSGAFSTDQNAQADLIVGSVVAYTELSFDASKASSVYNGSGVQSPALQLLPCIRT